MVIAHSPDRVWIRLGHNRYMGVMLVNLTFIVLSLLSSLNDVLFLNPLCEKYFRAFFISNNFNLSQSFFLDGTGVKTIQNGLDLSQLSRWTSSSTVRSSRMADPTRCTACCVQDSPCAACPATSVRMSSFARWTACKKQTTLSTITSAKCDSTESSGQICS